MADHDSKKTRRYATKKCYECFTHVALEDRECPICQAKLGKVNKIGIASKPTDWKAYTVCLLSWVTLVIFLWIGFF